MSILKDYGMVEILERVGVGSYRKIAVNGLACDDYLLKSRTRKTITPRKTLDEISIKGTRESSTARNP